MKKLLSILAAVGLTATASTAAVSCSSSSKSESPLAGFSVAKKGSDTIVSFTVKDVKLTKEATADDAAKEFALGTVTTKDGKDTNTKIDSTIRLTKGSEAKADKTSKKIAKDTEVSVVVEFANTVVTKDDVKISLFNLKDNGDLNESLKSFTVNTKTLNDAMKDKAQARGQKVADKFKQMHLFISATDMNAKDKDADKHGKDSYQQLVETLISSSIQDGLTKGDTLQIQDVRAASGKTGNIARQDIKVNGKAADGNTKDKVKAGDVVKVTGNFAASYYEVDGTQTSVNVAFTLTVEITK